MMKHLTMKLIMMKIWGLAVGSCWVLPVGVCREYTASRIGCVFLFFGRYFYFHDFGPKIMLWLLLYFYTPSGQINSEKIILQKHLAVILLVTMVSQQIIIITSVQSLCLADSGELILLVFYMLWDSHLMLLFTIASLRGFSKVGWTELSPRVKLSNIFLRCSMSYSSKQIQLAKSLFNCLAHLKQWTTCFFSFSFTKNTLNTSSSHTIQ